MEDPYHVLVVCSDPATVAARETFTRALPQHIEDIVRLLILPRHVVDRLTFKSRFAEIALREGSIQRIRNLAQATDWSSQDGKFALFHLLATATWSRRLCRADMPLSMALAEVFEDPVYEAKNHHIRPVSNRWANMGASGVLSIFRSWNARAAPLLADSDAALKSVRDATRNAAILNMKGQRVRKTSRTPRTSGGRRPTRFADFIVDLT